MYKNQKVIIDITHLGRGVVSGIERATSDLCVEGGLFDGSNVEYVRARNRYEMIFQQWIGIPLRMILHQNSFLLCTGFAPSLIISLFFRRRTILYVYDIFLISRKKDLNWRARFYLRPLFRIALRNLFSFFALTETVRQDLQAHTDGSAKVMVWRAPAHDVFNLRMLPDQRQNHIERKTIKVCSIGTVEPRKNYVVAAQICKQMSKLIGSRIELHIIGRRGWGTDYKSLQGFPHVILHDYLPDNELKALIAASDFFLYATKAEGLGLPAIEVQHGAIPVVANDLPVLREVLGTSALFVNFDNVERAAETLALNWRTGYIGRLGALSRENVERWNALAERDKEGVHSFIEDASIK